MRLLFNNSEFQRACEIFNSFSGTNLVWLSEVQNSFVDKVDSIAEYPGQKIDCSTCKNNVEYPPPHTCDVCTSLDEEMYCMWEKKRANGALMNYNKEIAKAFDRVSSLEGVESYHGEEVAIHGGHLDDYLLVGLLSRLINEGDVNIVIKNTISESNLDYLERLLHVKERGDLNAST